MHSVSFTTNLNTFRYRTMNILNIFLCLCHFTGRLNAIYFFRGSGAKPVSNVMLSLRMDSSESEWDTGVSYPGALKLDHLQRVELTSFTNISSFSHFILGGPIPYYPKERKG